MKMPRDCEIISKEINKFMLINQFISNPKALRIWGGKNKN